MSITIILAIITYISISIMMETKEESKRILQDSITTELTKLNTLSKNIEILYNKKHTYCNSLLKDELMSMAQMIDTKLILSDEISPERLVKLKDHHKVMNTKMADYVRLFSMSSQVNLNCNYPQVYYGKLDLKYSVARKSFCELKDDFILTFRKNHPTVILDILEDKVILDSIKREIGSLCKMAISRLERDDLRTAHKLFNLCESKLSEFNQLMDPIIGFRSKMHTIIFDLRVKESTVRTKITKIVESFDTLSEDLYAKYKACEQEKSFYFNAIAYNGDKIAQTKALDKLLEDLIELEDLIKKSKNKKKDTSYDNIFNDIFSEYGDCHYLRNTTTHHDYPEERHELYDK